MEAAQGNYMRVSARREFDQEGTDRDFKLKDVKKWAISFFDMSGSNAFSSVMDLNLSSTRPKNPPKPEAKVIVKEPLKVNDVCQSGGVETGPVEDRRNDCPIKSVCKPKEGLVAIGGEVAWYCQHVHLDPKISEEEERIADEKEANRLAEMKAKA